MDSWKIQRNRSKSIHSSFWWRWIDIYKLQNNNVELLFGKIKKLYSLDLFEYKNKINHRITKSGYNQNWHIDGRRIFELRPGKEKYINFSFYREIKDFYINSSEG